jgi:hypothetical protein
MNKFQKRLAKTMKVAMEINADLGELKTSYYKIRKTGRRQLKSQLY